MTRHTSRRSATSVPAPRAASGTLVRVLRARAVRLLTLPAVAAGTIAASCGGTPPEDTNLSPAAKAGMEVALRAGCQSCHGSNFSGGVAPTWKGLFGKTVELSDGRTVVAGEDYLTTAIQDPTADQVAGYRLQMPRNTLTDAEVADIVAYIKEL